MWSEEDMLRAWEQGEGRTPVLQAQALLQAGYPQQSLAQLDSLTVGQRDGLLFSLRERAFGSLLQGSARCPACGERSLFSLQTTDLRVSTTAAPPSLPLTLHHDDWVLRFRLPCSRDLQQAARLGEVSAARQQLLCSCLLSAHHSGIEVLARDLPAEVQQRLAAALAEQDAQSEVVLALHCAHCGHPWQALLDIVQFLWREVSARATQLLQDVATLARAFGWSESAVLQLGPVRRQRYLELAGHE